MMFLQQQNHKDGGLRKSLKRRIQKNEQPLQMLKRTELSRRTGQWTKAKKKKKKETDKAPRTDKGAKLSANRNRTTKKMTQSRASLQHRQVASLYSRQIFLQ